MKPPSHRRAQSPLRHAQTRHFNPGDEEPQAAKKHSSKKKAAVQDKAAAPAEPKQE